jgi:two-component system sensor histidine kinase CpxA
MLAPAPPPLPSGLSRPYEAGDRAVFVTPSRDGAHRLITMAPLPYQLRDLLPQFALITAAVVLAFWLLAADVARPLRRLANTVERFGRGDLAVRADVARRDEIGGLARAFNDMAARTESLVTAERRLLQDVSHELRSPLTRLNLAIELSRTAPDRQQAADRLQREATRLSDLVGTLLEVVRLEGEPGSTPTMPVRLMEIVQESIENGAAEADRRSVRLCLSGDLPGVMMGNAELLRRALDNIVGNAVRYAPPGSAVSLTCSATPALYAIEVRDMGPGVRDDQIEKLGTALYRTDESRSSDTGGLGLGLAIARRAIHLHAGRVEFANAQPGLRVTVRLPHDEALA